MLLIEWKGTSTLESPDLGFTSLCCGINGPGFLPLEGQY